jgi:hypothetical protein
VTVLLDDNLIRATLLVTEESHGATAKDLKTTETADELSVLYWTSETVFYSGNTYEPSL